MNVHALFHEAVQPEGAVLLDVHHAAELFFAVLHGDQRKLEGFLGVVVLFPVDLQKLFVYFGGGLSVQLDQVLSLRLGDLEGHAQGDPADGLVHIEMQIVLINEPFHKI